MLPAIFPFDLLTISSLFFLLACGPFLGRDARADERPRVLVLTDYYKDPDDKQSMIRLLCFSNELQLEGLIATSLAFGNGEVSPEKLFATIDDYARVFDNLKKHATSGYDFPSPDHLRSLVKVGAPVIRRSLGTSNRGFLIPYPPGERDSRICDPVHQWIGADKDTEASEHIIDVVDRDDFRPVWITVWGGAMDLAQALWKVRHQRNDADAAHFIGKLRVYQISWQDTGAVWIWENFPELFLIQSAGANRGIYRQGDPKLRDEAWVDENIRTHHGPLGGSYPRAGRTVGIKEGDSSSFFHLLAAGLSNPEHPEWGGWGGRFVRLDKERRFFVPAHDEHPASTDRDAQVEWTVGRWNAATSSEFAARMDWCVKELIDSNHAPVAIVNNEETPNVLSQSIQSGQNTLLDASLSHDPDGDSLNYRWWQYVEAGSCQSQLTIRDSSSPKASFMAPSVSQPETLHVILEVVDNGQPALTSYRRLIYTVEPAP